MIKKSVFYIFFIITIILANLPSIFSYHYNYSGEKSYIEEKYDNAIKSFEKSKSANSFYNLWNSYYKKKDYKNAIENYLLSWNIWNDNIKFSSFHNLWNSYYRYWKQDEKTKLENFLNSVSYYEKALKIKNDEETKKNRDFVLEKIKELKDQEKDKNEQKQNWQEDNKDSKQEENSTNKNESKENKTNENSQKNDSWNEKNWEKSWNKENEQKQNWQNEENQNNDWEKKTSSSSQWEDDKKLDEAQKAQLDEYKKTLNQMQNQYSQWFNKVYNEWNEDPFSDDFFFNSFFDNNINQKEKDW